MVGRGNCCQYIDLVESGQHLGAIFSPVFICSASRYFRERARLVLLMALLTVASTDSGTNTQDAASWYYVDPLLGQSMKHPSLPTLNTVTAVTSISLSCIYQLVWKFARFGIKGSAFFAAKNNTKIKLKPEIKLTVKKKGNQRYEKIIQTTSIAFLTTSLLTASYDSVYVARQANAFNSQPARQRHSHGHACTGSNILGRNNEESTL